MAKRTYIGVSAAARKVKRGHIGSGGAARKVKKVYIGIGGIARPCWSGGKLVYYGTADPVSVARRGGVGVSVGQYFLAAGGASLYTAASTYYSTVDVYNRELTHTTADGLTNAVAQASGATLNDTYAMFFGGGSGRSIFSTVNAYNQQLVKTSPSELSAAARYACAVSVGTNVVVGGGFSATSWTYGATVNSYNENLTRSVLPNLPEAMLCTGATVGNYGLMVSRYADGNLAVAYNKSLTRTNLSVSQYGGHGCRGEACAVFADYTFAYSYTSELTQVVLTPLTGTRVSPATAYLEGYSIYAGGLEGNTTPSTIVEAYFEGTLMPLTGLSAARSGDEVNAACSGTVGGYVLFSAGYNAGGNLNAVDVYTV